MRRLLTTTLTAAALAASALFTGVAPANAAAMQVTAGFMIEGATSFCTVSFTDPRTPTLAYTASHCYKPGTSTAVHLGNQRLGDFIPEISNRDLDLIAIRLNSGIRGSKVLQSGEPLLSTWVPKPGTTVCKYGATTQETCGTVLASEDDRFTVRMAADHGDSGAPIYQRLDTKEEHGVHLVGTVIAESKEDPDVIICTPMTSIQAFLGNTFGSWRM